MAHDSTGQYLPDDCAESFAYNADGSIAAITRTFGIDSWVQTYTYSNGVISQVSGWVKQ